MSRMSDPIPPPSARRAAVIGLIGLAAAMGIGRFAFTPLLPLMQAQDGLLLVQGSYLASANYGGYLLGALLLFVLNPSPTLAARWGLAAVAASTLAMAATSSVPLWLALRAIAGIASAFVLVGVSAWAMTELALANRASWSGWVFAGVGIGMCFAGMAVLAVAAAARPPSFGWLVLGLAAALAALLGLVAIRPTAAAVPSATTAAATSAAATAVGGSISPSAWPMVLAYGGFGFGYIIPATFLPASARALVVDPAVFGWIWPIFGLAAAISTVLASSLFRQAGPRRLWLVAQMMMACGVALPALHTSLISILISALVVGGTFMVVTMSGLQEGRRVGGAAASRLMAAMTAAFAAGQLLGPFTVGAAGTAVEAIRTPSLVAAAVLALTACLLLLGRESRQAHEAGATAARRG